MKSKDEEYTRRRIEESPLRFFINRVSPNQGTGGSDNLIPKTDDPQFFGPQRKFFSNEE